MKNQKKLNQSRTPINKSPRHSSSCAPGVQTFTYHVRELRRRLFLSAIVGVIVGSMVYYYHDFFIKIVMDPLGDQKLIYLTPAGGFSFVFMVTFYITILIVLPFLMYQLYAFIRPAIPRHTKRLSMLVSLAAILLMIAGATFGYLYAVPGGLNFLSNFASEYITASITADSYLSFVLGYVLGIGMLFELPLLLLFWHWIHPLTPKGLLNSERFVIVGAFIASAILSPSPDALSQAVIAIPIIIVYQLGVGAVFISIAREQRKLEKKTRPPQSITAALPQSGSPAVAQVEKVAASRKIVSIDGMMAAKSPAAFRSYSQVAPPSQAPTRSRSMLVVSPRTRLISDFKPIRNSAIDTTR